MNKLTVIDLFCGAGGFSEGFCQQGFDILQGVDSWRPAIETFNHNFGLDCKPQDIRIFADSVQAIEKIPDTDVILGSPPCVSFSTSNKCGNADKTSGINLTEIFFRIVAVKMHKADSNLKAWFMENVANSAKYIKPYYSFSDLNLGVWAKGLGKKANDIAIDFENNHLIVNSADYGVAQIRKRLFAGEIISKSGLPQILDSVPKQPHKTLEDIFKNFPSPLKRKRKIIDPNYEGLVLSGNQLTDYSYDTGIYEALWRDSKYLKTNHPYMGKMSFPENWQKPSRTITSTKIVTSREALIYPDELERKGDGEFRTPTVREAAILMSFPISYQFMGPESTKWKLVGNAVCPKLSAVIASELLRHMGRRRKRQPLLVHDVELENIPNLNNPSPETFLSLPQRKENSRFRRHPFKIGNMTVALSNYDLGKNKDADGKWRTTVTYGTGQDFKLQIVNPSKVLQQIFDLAVENFDEAENLFHEVHNGFTDWIADGQTLQKLYEKNSSSRHLNPVSLVEEAARIISKYADDETIAMREASKIFKYKDKVHKRQIYALYVLSHISMIANGVK